MQKWIIIFSVQLILWPSLNAQDQVGCNQLLEDAKEAYAAGMVELVPELLNSCLESGGLIGTAKQEAYVLVITAYLFDYLPDQADVYMVRFLNEFPNYTASTSDPSEFAILLNSHKEQMAIQQEEKRRQDILDEQARREELARQEQLRKQQKNVKQKSSKPASSSVPALGFILGTNLSFPQLLEPYGVSDPATNGGDFGIGSPGFHVGASVFLPISDAIDVSIDLQYRKVRYNFSATPFPFTSYVYDEYQDRFDLPVSFLFYLNPHGNSKFYFRLGLVADYLLKSSASAVRNYSGTGALPPDVVLDKAENTSSRSKMNLSAMGGMGMKFPLKSGFIFAEARYQYGILQTNIVSERYSNQDMTWLIYHVDSDFKLHQLSISVGMAFNLK